MKKFGSLIFVFIFLLSVAIIPADAYNPTFETHAKAVFLYNVDTDTVVYSKNPDTKLYPASLTKIMVGVLLLEKNQNLEELELTVSEKIAEEYKYSEAVTAGFEAGEKVNGYDLLAYTIVKSCADAASVVAEYVSGSEEEFIKLMNSRAKEIGLTATNFTNCHGLHDENHYSTARDMCTLTNYALKFQAIKDVAKVARYETKNGITLAATNLLIDPSTDYYYRYATGFKTGYTTEAGRCLASTATYEGMTYISILLGCPPQDNSIINRYEFIDTAELFRWAFESFSYRSVLTNSETVDSIPIDYSWDYDMLNVIPKDEVYALVPNEADESTFEIKIDYKNKRAEAPIKKGEQVGVLKVYYAGHQIGESPAVAAESVEGSQILRLTTGIQRFLVKHKSIFIAVCLIVMIFIIVFIAITIRLNSKRKKYGRVKRYKRF